MRLALFVLLTGLPVSTAAQHASTCQPTRPLVVDTTRAVLGVRARDKGDTLEDRVLTRRLGEAMLAASFTVPGTVSRSFYPGTGGGPMASADQVPRTRLLARVTVDPQIMRTPSWRVDLETASEDPATDTLFLRAIREAVALVRPGDTTSGVSWVAELVVAAPGDPSVHPLARLTIPAIRLEHPVKLLRAPMPKYPREHREQGKGGVVRVQYVIDERGRAEPVSLRVLRAPSLAFAEAAKEVILNAEYTPAEAGGCPQKQLVQQNVRFELRAR